MAGRDAELKVECGEILTEPSLLFLLFRHVILCFLIYWGRCGPRKCFNYYYYYFLNNQM